MGNILTAKVQIEGVRPLMWHAFKPEMMSAPEGGRKAREGSAGNDPSEWKLSVLMNDKRQLFIPPTYVFGCVREAAKYTKKGRGSIQATMGATLLVTDDVILIDRFVPEEDKLTTDATQPVYLSIMGVKNPATKGKNVRYRIAAASGWKAEFNLMWDKTLISKGEMQAVLNDAGQLVGLADGRSIGFGRFRVLDFEAEESSK